MSGKRAEVTAQLPMRRFADPREMASTVAFLATRDAGYITGADAPVDGGILI